MTTAEDQHIALVIAVNESATEADHEAAEAMLRGFRDGMRAAGHEPYLMGCDWHYIEQGIDRPMCCGVWLDWKPSE